MKKINLENMMLARNAYRYADSEIHFYQAHRDWRNAEQNIADFTEKRDEANKKYVDFITKSGINEAIRAAEGRAKERRINIECILDAINDVEELLNINKKAMEGISVDCDPNAQHFPKAYKFTPESTQFTIKFEHNKWWLTDIRRENCRNTKKAVIHHTEASKAALIDRLSVIE